MKLKDILNFSQIVSLKNVDLKKDISFLCDKSSRKQKAAMFFCVSGTEFDGHNFAEEALKNGAQILIVERFLNLNVSQILVKNSRKAMSLFAKNFYYKCCDELKVIGITGTNGKTTTTFMIDKILKTYGKKVGIIGTLGIFFDGKKQVNNLTTPDPINLHRIFYEMKNTGVEYVVMEISAHALALHKLDGVKFEVGVITNITRDHLDFFVSFDNYKNTKIAFLNKNQVKSAVINIDDSNLIGLLEKLEVPFLTFGFENPADIFPLDLIMSAQGSSFIVNAVDNVFTVKTGVTGKYNIENILTAISVCLMLGVDIISLEKGIQKFKNVPGRFNVIKGVDFDVVIDYAHTPDGLENVLKTIKGFLRGRLLCVFGCGGNRDKTKRSVMGLVAQKYSDIVIVTSDNPRFEKPVDIINEITIQMNKNKFIIIEDRKNAIDYAINLARKDDIIAICGKGAENYLDISGKKYKYSDLSQVKKAIKNLRYRSENF